MAIRIGGLASGMDTDQIVTDLMKAERIPLNKLTQKKQILEWQREEYREMNKLLNDFDQFIYGNMTLQKDFLKKKVTSSDTSAVTAVANSSAANIGTRIEVTQIAKSANWISSGPTTFTGGVQRTLDLSVTKGDGSTSNNIQIVIEENDTLENVISKLSNNKDLGISVFRDTHTGQVVITKKETGEKAAITLNNTDSTEIFKSLGFTDAAVGSNLTVGSGTQGKDSIFSINGLTTSRTTNTFVVDNVTYTLHKDNSAANVSLSNDTDNMVDKVVQFVNKYNELIEKVNGKMNEEKYRSYQPLTDTEKETMTEKQIELWEERAKSGLIKNDSILSGALTKMRSDLYNPNNSNVDFKQLAQIGITTSSNYLDKGKLLINETKLRDAVAKDPTAIFQLFNSSGSTTESVGLAKRIRETISTTIKSIEKKAGKNTSTNQQFTIGRNLTNLNKQINRFEDRLIKVEDRYWSQFSAMEQAIQKSNSQMSYLMQQFSS
ncbi:flagellar hook-associated protein 2 [Metabacillus litoralis]|uniref:flagellar hook-associated protein 2 n=1 Tax=Metabacillus litoralis TaxID=152268 RepID=UPI001CFEEBC0|nr:flagellar hook-associated protein 2 [Metabacillus litoralis]